MHAHFIIIHGQINVKYAKQREDTILRPLFLHRVQELHQHHAFIHLGIAQAVIIGTEIIQLHAVIHAMHAVNGHA